MTGFGLVGLTGLHLAKGDLNGVVAIPLHGLDLDHVDRTGFDDGHRDGPGLIVKDLGHAQLLSENRVHSFISTSTPAGSSRRIKESTVLGVGSRMSIRRL